VPELDPKLTEGYELGYRDGIRRMVRWMEETADRMQKDMENQMFSPRQPSPPVLRAQNLRDHAKDFKKFADETPWDQVKDA